MHFVVSARALPPYHHGEGVHVTCVFLCQPIAGLKTNMALQASATKGSSEFTPGSPELDIQGTIEAQRPRLYERSKELGGNAIPDVPWQEQ